MSSVGGFGGGIFLHMTDCREGATHLNSESIQVCVLRHFLFDFFMYEIIETFQVPNYCWCKQSNSLVCKQSNKTKAKNSNLPLHV